MFLLQALPNLSHRGRRMTLVLVLQVRKLHKRVARVRAEINDVTLIYVSNTNPNANHSRVKKEEKNRYA